MTDKETRILVGVRVEERAASEPRKIVGYAAVFNSPTDIGGQFREQVKPGAFAQALQRDDVHALFNHDYGVVLGRKSAGTLSISEDEHGLRVEITLPDTVAARDLATNIAAGNIDQMSFAFSMRGGVQSWDDSQNPPLRTIEQVGELFEVSVVPRGAYPDTTAAVRSLDEARAAAMKEHNRNGALTRRMQRNLRKRRLA